LGILNKTTNLGFFSQTDLQNSVLAIEEYSLVRIYRFIPVD